MDSANSVFDSTHDWDSANSAVNSAITAVIQRIEKEFSAYQPQFSENDHGFSAQMGFSEPGF